MVERRGLSRDAPHLVRTGYENQEVLAVPQGPILGVLGEGADSEGSWSPDPTSGPLIQPRGLLFASPEPCGKHPVRAPQGAQSGSSLRSQNRLWDGPPPPAACSDHTNLSFEAEAVNLTLAFAVIW